MRKQVAASPAFTHIYNDSRCLLDSSLMREKPIGNRSKDPAFY